MKKSKVQLSERASWDVETAADYYSRISPQLGKIFKARVARALKSLRRFNAYEVKFRDYRIYHLRPFPYSMYFKRMDDGVIVSIEAVLHESREAKFD